jgi:hypothetical protein
MTMRLPGTNSSATQRNGPLPTHSAACLNGSAQRRSGMIAQVGWVLASALGRNGKGFFRRQTRVRSSLAISSSMRSLMKPPTGSRAIQRRIDARASRARTGVPSWNVWPWRSTMVQRLPSSSTVCPSSICGCGFSDMSRVYSVSYSISPSVRVACAGVKHGS